MAKVLQPTVRCPDCNGSGRVPTEFYGSDLLLTCGTCFGIGWTDPRVETDPELQKVKHEQVLEVFYYTGRERRRG
jgi:DnaJ-class molecular chaperone